MVVKVYVSGISGNKEVKKRQQRVLMILDSKNIKYDIIDITEPGKEADKDFMQNNSKSNGGTVSDPNPRHPLPPQVFNDDEYCGDYDLFDLANEVDSLEQFLKVEVPPEPSFQVESAEKENAANGEVQENEESNAPKETLEGQDKSTEDGQTLKEDTPARERTPIKEGTPAKEGTPLKEGTPVKEGTPLKEGTPGKEGTPLKEGTPAKEGTPLKEGTPTTEGTPAKEGTPDKNIKTSRGGTPANDRSMSKEGTPEKVNESTPAEKENSPITESHAEKSSKEASLKKTSVNENGTVSSREQSEEKKQLNEEKQDVTELKKDNPSEALIQSEQQAANE